MELAPDGVVAARNLPVTDHGTMNHLTSSNAGWGIYYFCIVHKRLLVITIIPGMNYRSRKELVSICIVPGYYFEFSSAIDISPISG